MGSDEWTERHLTPRGWIVGEEVTDSYKMGSSAPPEDRVLTVVYRELITPGSSERGSEEMWRAPNDKRIPKLLKKFGTAPEHL